MTPQFAKAVDPIFMQVLNLLERIGRDESPSPQDERARIRGYLDQAEAMLGRSEDWEAAKYALICWVDEVLIDAPWEGRNWWYENAMEVEIFRTRSANEQFYERAKLAASLSKKDALEVFYVCVVLGFRGLYRSAEAAAILAESHGLPQRLEDWAKQTSLAIRIGMGRPPITAEGKVAGSAPPLEGQPLLVASSLITVVLGAVTVVVALALFSDVLT
jgi:type VI secretion system protein ImpK